MDRREFLVGQIAFGPAATQLSGLTHGTLAATKLPNPGQVEGNKPKRNDAEYVICKHRGHVADPAGSPNFVNATYTRPTPEFVTRPGYAHESDWQVCYFCGKEFRLVRKLEER